MCRPRNTLTSYKRLLIDARLGRLVASRPLLCEPIGTAVLPPASNLPVLPARPHLEYDKAITYLLMTKTKNTPILNQLRKYRKARGLKQREAARILGFADASSLSRWEQGVCLPSVKNLFRLAALYRTLVDALYIDAVRAVREEVRRREVDMLPHEDHAC